MITSTICKNHRQTELIFKCLRQNLAVKHFFRNSINVAKAQIWLAACASQLVLLTITQHRLPVSPQIFLHLIETNMFTKIALDQLIANALESEEERPFGNKLILLIN